MSIRIAVATEDFGGPLRRSISLAGDQGVSGVRLNARTELLSMGGASSSALRQILLYIRENRMEVAGLICPTRHALYDQAFLEERIELIRQCISLVRPLATRELLIRCGRIPDPDSVSTDTSGGKSFGSPENPFSFGSSPPSAPVRSSASEFTLLCEVLNDLASHANHTGCTLNLILSRYDVALVRRLLAEIKNGPVQVVFDPGTAIMAGSVPDRVVSLYRDLYDVVGYVRGRDALRDVDGAGVEAVLGDGSVDWAEFLPALVEAPFDGWFCVERTGGDHRAEDVRNAVNVLRSLLPQSS